MEENKDRGIKVIPLPGNAGTKYKGPEANVKEPENQMVDLVPGNCGKQFGKKTVDHCGWRIKDF